MSCDARVTERRMAAVWTARLGLAVGCWPGAEDGTAGQEETIMFYVNCGHRLHSAHHPDLRTWLRYHVFIKIIKKDQNIKLIYTLHRSKSNNKDFTEFQIILVKLMV